MAFADQRKKSVQSGCQPERLEMKLEIFFDDREDDDDDSDEQASNKGAES